MRQISTLLIILAVATLAVAAAAQPAKLDLNAIGAMPGTEIRKEKSSTGEDIVIIARGGVEITVDGNRSIGIDRSGHGAVLCVWQIYAHVKIVLDSCYPGEQQELRDDINSALDAINDFIVANSLTPVKKSNLEAQLIKMGDDFQLPQSGLARKCSIERSGGLVRAVIAMPREKRKAQLDDLLSLPRPPVLNPCL